MRVGTWTGACLMVGGVPHEAPNVEAVILLAAEHDLTEIHYGEKRVRVLRWDLAGGLPRRQKHLADLMRFAFFGHEMPTCATGREEVGWHARKDHDLEGADDVRLP